MKTWYKLTPEETTQVYCVPTEVAHNPSNHFWGLTYDYIQELFDGSRPLIVIASNEKYPSVVTLQIHTLHMEVLHDGDLNYFNPLEANTEGGLLSLTVEQINGLCEILRAQKHLFIDDGSIVTRQPVFRLLQDDEISIYRLHPDWFPGLEQSYYLQIAKPGMPVAQNTISLVCIDSEMSISVMTFQQDDLLDESFTPLKRSGPQLYLNWTGLLELVDILSQAVNRAN